MTKFRDRAHAIAWAKDLVNRSDVLYVDTETTGVRYGQDDVIDIGIVDGAGRTLMDQLVRPMVPIPADAAEIHGISNKDVQTAPRLADLWADVTTLLSGRVLVSYNADFDKRMLFGAGAKRELPIIRPQRWDCAMEAYAAWNGEMSHHRRGYRWINLGAAARNLGIDPPEHRAVADALVCLEVVQELSRRG